MYELIPQKLKNEALFCVWKRVIEKNKIQKKPFRANGRHHIAIPSILQTSKQPVRYRLTVMKASELVCSTTSVLWIMNEFDNNRLLFDCDNGTIELQPFYFCEHRPEDFITKISSVLYAPNTQNQRFLKFVKEIMSDDMEKTRFLQKTEGYEITGETLYECIFIHYRSTTRNGKGTFDESVLSVTGDYGRAVTLKPSHRKTISAVSPQARILQDLQVSVSPIYLNRKRDTN